jgi:multidrug efflux system membrane fusion protein
VLGADNKVTYRTIKLGPIVDGLRIVRSGLKKDERIVVNGLQRIRPNDLVTPVTVAMDGEQLAPAKNALAVAAAK